MSLSDAARLVTDNASTAQCVLFIAIFATSWLVEKFVLAQPAAQKLRHTGFNLAFLAIVTPVQLVAIALCVAVANWNTDNHWGLVYLLPHAESGWIKFGLMFLALDFLDYVYHRMAHRLAPLWRLHLVHHSDRSVDVSTTFREHPAETLVRVAFLTLFVFVCGASLPVLILRQTFETFANVSQHTSFRLPPRAARVLGWVFVTPNLHHTHHHFELPGTNCNYGDVFSIWDRIFGTYVHIATSDIVFGIDTHMEPGASSSFAGLLGLGRFARRSRGHEQFSEAAAAEA